MPTYKNFRLDYTNYNHLKKPSDITVKKLVDDLILADFPGTKIADWVYDEITKRTGNNAIKMEYDCKKKAWKAVQFFNEAKGKKRRLA